MEKDEDVKIVISQKGTIPVYTTTRIAGVEIFHDESLEGKGTPSIPLKISEEIIEKIENAGKVDDVEVNGVSVVENKIANVIVPTKVSELDNDEGYITGVDWDDVTNKPQFANVATSGDYNDLSNTPTIGDGTLTIQKNGTTVATFTANQTGNVTANIVADQQVQADWNEADTTAPDYIKNKPTKVSDFTNDADYQNGTQVSNTVSGAINTHNTSNDAHSNLLTPITQDIDDIEAVIPAQASEENKLADKNFVNSSVATNTAYFIGTFNSVEELEAYSGTLTNNDYAFVVSTDAAGNTVYDRYKYNADTQQWIFEYELNNSSFTADQWAAINSGATSEAIAQIDTNTGTISEHIADKNNPHEVTKAQVGLGNVDNTSDLNKPISTATQTALNAKQDTLTAGTNITITNNVISSTAQESFFRGNFNEWSDVPTDANSYVEDIHGNRIPQNTDFIVIEDASQFVPSGSLMHKLTVENLHATESFTIRITDENGVSQKYFYYPYRNGFVAIDEYYSLRYNSGIPGIWYIKTNDGSPIIIKGTTYSSGQAQLCTTNDPATPFDVGMPPSAGQYTGAWRFAYYGVWANDGITGWTPQYKIENTLPIANETTFGIAKLYTTTGNNTDGAVDQATVTSALSAKQDTLVSGTNIKTVNNNSLLGTGNISTLTTISYNAETEELTIS